MADAAIVTPDTTVGWPRRVVILLATAGAGLGALSWWQAFDHSTAMLIQLAVLAVAPAVPVFLPSRMGFVTACRIASLLLVAATAALLFSFLVWSFLSAVAIALVGESAQLVRPLPRAAVLFFGLVVTCGMIALFSFTAFFR